MREELDNLEKWYKKYYRDNGDDVYISGLINDVRRKIIAKFEDLESEIDSLEYRLEECENENKVNEQ